MNNVISDKDNQKHAFAFTGKGGQYFVICLLNVLLVCITLGIYFPWAIVKVRRYIYSHMELNGQAFSYKATGGALFFSFLFVFVIYGVSMTFLFHHNVIGGAIIFGLFFLSIPFMIVKSIQYQAMMTSLNGIQFGFQCSMLRAWWVMLGLPVLLMALLYGVEYLLFVLTDSVSGINGTIIRFAFLALVFIVGLGVVNGIIYSKWMALMGNGGRFGIHRFAIVADIKQCIKGCVLAWLSIIPFFALVCYLIGPFVSQIILLSATGGLTEEVYQGIIVENIFRIITAYALYFIALIVVVSYMYVATRNQFINNLTLADGTIRFHSSVTGHGMVVRLILMLLVGGVTLGLAYPWMKIWFIGWLARNTQVQGNIDTLPLTNDESPQAGGLLMWISRGIMPYIPFI